MQKNIVQINAGVVWGALNKKMVKQKTIYLDTKNKLFLVSKKS